MQGAGIPTNVIIEVVLHASRLTKEATNLLFLIVQGGSLFLCNLRFYDLINEYIPRLVHVDTITEVT